MAEFVEVCGQLIRRAQIDAAQDGEHVQGICIYVSADDRSIVRNGTTFYPAEVIERDIMKWAAAHPEPKLVYPTWSEWFSKRYPIGDIHFFCPKVFDADFDCIDDEECNECLERQIPKDIAQALHIEPKEET